MLHFHFLLRKSAEMFSFDFVHDISDWVCRFEWFPVRRNSHEKGGSKRKFKQIVAGQIRLKNVLTLLQLRTPSIFITRQFQTLGKHVYGARANRNTLEEGKKEVSARIFCESEHKLHVAAIIAERIMAHKTRVVLSAITTLTYMEQSIEFLSEQTRIFVERNDFKN